MSTLGRDREEAVIRFLDGGDLGDVPLEPVDWYGLPVERVRRRARAEHNRRDGVPETVVYVNTTGDDPGAVAEFYSLVIVPLDDERGEPWLVWGDLRADLAGAVVIGACAVAPWAEQFGQAGIGAGWNGIKPAKIREAATEALRLIAGSHHLAAVFKLKVPLVDPSVGARATELEAATPRRRRGNPGKPDRDYFEFAARWLSAQSDPKKGGVYRQLERDYGKGLETLKSTRRVAETRGFLGEGKPYQPARRLPGPRYLAFLESLADDDPLKTLAIDAVPVAVRDIWKREPPSRRRNRKES